jgi:tetratricopeptide (TPR) repeat protein
MPRPLCFVLMPFGKKPTAAGTVIDFNATYEEMIKPAIEAADLEPLRADEESRGGIIHAPMFERLILCEYAVCDLTTANANVFYELGLRHAVRPASTVLLFAEGTGQMPFDVAPLRAIPYTLKEGKPEPGGRAGELLAERLRQARDNTPDSPVYELVDGFPDIQRLKTDVFRDRVSYSEHIKQRLARARTQGTEAVRAVACELGAVRDVEAGVVIDLLLAYRDLKAWDDMIALVQKISPPLAATVLVQEQLGLALNRAGRGDEAERVLLDVIARHGPSSETYGILGRVYKDRWEKAAQAGNALLARGHLVRAIDAYVKGFEADWRDAYPGINAVTLMEIAQPPDPRRAQLVPVVRYAVERRIAAGRPDYWDHATRLELAVLGRDEPGAAEAAANAMAAVHEPWMLETTARNLRLIREARARRGEVVPWADAIEHAWIDTTSRRRAGSGG